MTAVEVTLFELYCDHEGCAEAWVGPVGGRSRAERQAVVAGWVLVGGRHFCSSHHPEGE